MLATREAKTNGLWASKDIHDRLWPRQIKTVRPLMPLRKGHLAMLIAAGFLNNLVIESEQGPLMIRGQAIKKLELTSSEDGKDVYHERLKTNVVSLNLTNGVFEDILTESTSLE